MNSKDNKRLLNNLQAAHSTKIKLINKIQPQDNKFLILIQNYNKTRGNLASRTAQ